MQIRPMLFLLAGLLAGSVSVQAAPWGAFPFDPQETLVQKDRPYYILSQLSDGKPLYIYMEFSEPEQDEMYRSLYQKEIAKSYQRWFKNASYYIKQNKRSKEFVRMLARLNKPGKIIFVTNEQEADLLVKVISWNEVQENCHGHETLQQGTMACVLFEKGKLPILYAPTLAAIKDFMISTDSRAADIKNVEQRMFFEFILPHEIGHTLGLDDQYDEGRKSHRMYRSTHIRKGMMRDVKGFTCDDADGPNETIYCINQQEETCQKICGSHGCTVQ